MSARVLLAWLWAGLYASFIFALSSQSHPIPYFELIEKNHFDWILHSVEYGVLGFLLADALGKTFQFRSRALLIFLALVLGACYGMSDEWHQSFVPERDASASDVAADAVGVLGGAWMSTHRKQKDSQWR